MLILLVLIAVALMYRPYYWYRPFGFYRPHHHMYRRPMGGFGHMSGPRGPRGGMPGGRPHMGHR